jgi:ABC-type Fe3+ transport system substrate-binding protein
MLYTAKAPEGLAKAFIDFALSDEGQKLVTDQHFVPMAKSDQKDK